MPRKKKLVLIDGNALIHRGFHAFSRAALASPTGEPTGATYGFAMMLLDIFTKLNPDYIAVAFDTRKPTFRHEEYKEYKATRIEAPQELYDQIPRIQELVETFNIPMFLKDGFEADDIIGTLAIQAPKDIDVYIATGDMDTLQLVSNNIFVYAPRKGFADIVMYDADEVFKSKGLKPEQMIDFKGLRGDPSDNIPGVPGIGEITAKKLLHEFGTMENVYKNLSKVPEKTRSLLEKHKNIALQSKKLATILTTVPIKLDLKKAEAVEFNPAEVKQLFDKLGFRSLVSKIPNGTLTVSTNQHSFFDNAPRGAKGKTRPVRNLENGLTDKVFQLNKPNIAKISNGMSYTEKLDKDLEPILRKMEKVGIMLDLKKLDELNKQITTRLKRLTTNIHKHASLRPGGPQGPEGENFNINSPIQLSEILFKKLKLPTLNISKTKTGYSTAVAELEKLYGEHPIIKHILEYRQLEKLRNTYLETLPKLVDKNNRVHTTYAQDTSTGRLSSSDPNLQNIPIRSEIGAEIRKAFIAPKGYRILAADYSQIELRIVASLAQDERMIKSFDKGEDIHSRVAAEINNVSLKEITKDMRRDAKVINFGIIYGVSPYGLAARTDMTIKQAKDYIDRYFKHHPHIKKYMKDIVAFAQKHGYVETLFGRRREMPEIKSKIVPVQRAAQRAAINMPIQGTAADIMKAAMIEIDKQLPKISKDAKMLLQVHDELVFEVPTKDIKKVAKLVKTAMENVYKLEVPTIAKVESGKSWGETKKV